MVGRRSARVNSSWQWALAQSPGIGGAQPQLALGARSWRAGCARRTRIMTLPVPACIVARERSIAPRPAIKAPLGRGRGPKPADVLLGRAGARVGGWRPATCMGIDAGSRKRSQTTTNPPRIPAAKQLCTRSFQPNMQQQQQQQGCAWSSMHHACHASRNRTACARRERTDLAPGDDRPTGQMLGALAMRGLPSRPAWPLQSGARLARPMHICATTATLSKKQGAQKRRSVALRGRHVAARPTRSLQRLALREPPPGGLDGFQRRTADGHAAMCRGRPKQGAQAQVGGQCATRAVRRYGLALGWSCDEQSAQTY